MRNDYYIHTNFILLYYFWICVFKVFYTFSVYIYFISFRIKRITMDSLNIFAPPAHGTQGYKVNLKTKLPKKWICPLCNMLMRDAIQTYRGEMACESCYLNAKGYVFCLSIMFCLSTSPFCKKDFKCFGGRDNMSE